ncbi:MAG: response regulator [Bacillota bacterium]|nr:response regulator [Bacillota bacterium]
MYKILIVDDEAIVRDGMRDNVDWAELGFELVGACKNGSEALDVLESENIDIVLTDICMPYIDGLELTKRIMENYPFTKVLILTGYDEFEYAQKAIKLKAYDFILKPITAVELSKVLNKLKDDLNEEKKRTEDIDRIKNQLNESLPTLKERFFNSIIMGSIPKNISEKLNMFEVNFSGNNFIVIAIQIGESSKNDNTSHLWDDELLTLSVYNICEDILCKVKGNIVFQNWHNIMIAIISMQNQEELYQYALKNSEEIRQSVEKYMDITVTIGIGKPCTGISNIQTSYKGAISALGYCFILGNNRVIGISEMEENFIRPSYNKELERKLISLIKTGPVEDIDAVVESIFRKMKESYLPIQRCLINIHHDIVYILSSLDEVGILVDEILDQLENPLASTCAMRTLNELEAWFKEFCKKTYFSIIKKMDDYNKMQAMKALEYLKENYMDSRISLNSVCKHLLMSTSFFSNLFKRYQGETFIECLTRLRVERAMELLNSTSLKSYEVAYKVGYPDPHYFSSVFKKLTGFSPKEYREKSK